MAIALAAVAFSCAIGISAQSEDAIGAPDAAADVQASGTYTRRLLEMVTSGMDMEEAISSMGFKRLAEGEVPKWFEEEIAPVSIFTDMRGNDQLTLIGFSSEKTPEDAVSQIEGELLARGWKRCDEGYDHIATYMKEKGECTWLMLECARSGDEAAGVLHIRRS